jgi:hypothetical protein
MVIDTAKTVDTVITPALLNIVPTAWPSAQPYANG